MIFCTMPLKSVFPKEKTLSVETFMNEPLFMKLTKYPVISRPATEMWIKTLFTTRFPDTAKIRKKLPKPDTIFFEKGIL